MEAGQYGIAGLVVFSLLSIFVWWIKAAREDLRATQHEFVKHLTATGNRQTEAIVKSTDALQGVLSMMNRHEEAATARHEQIMREIRDRRVQ